MEDFKDLTGKVYDYQLLTKALLLSSSIKIHERILTSNDESLKNSYLQWIQKKEFLTIALSMSTDQLVENGIDPSHNEYVHKAHGFMGGREEYRALR